MSEISKPIRLKFLAWQKNYYAGKFVEWIRVGKGYVKIEDGRPVKTHTRYQSIVRGDSVNTIMLPVGKTPRSLYSPKRPDDNADEDEDL